MSRSVFSSGSQVPRGFFKFMKHDHNCPPCLGPKDYCMCQTLNGPYSAHIFEVQVCVLEWFSGFKRVFQLYEKLVIVHHVWVQHQSSMCQTLWTASTCIKPPNSRGQIQTACLLCTHITSETTDLRVIWSFAREGPVFSEVQVRVFEWFSGPRVVFKFMKKSWLFTTYGFKTNVYVPNTLNGPYSPHISWKFMIFEPTAGPRRIIWRNAVPLNK